MAGGRVTQWPFAIVSGIAVCFVNEGDKVDDVVNFLSSMLRVMLGKPEPLEEEGGKGHRGNMVRFIRNLIATRRGTSGRH